MNPHKIARLILGFAAGFVFPGLASCNDPVIPKPKGYLRIELPEISYRPFDSAQHYRFEASNQATVEAVGQKEGQSDWFTIVYPRFKAEVYLSYKPVGNNIADYLEDARTLAFKHLPKASGIADSLITNPKNSVFGNFYFLKGKGVASPIQFYLTDSINHFVRGALYFDFRPDNDSIAPVIEYLKKDLNHLAATFEWK